MIRKHPIKDDYLGCWGVATFASNTNLSFSNTYTQKS